MKLPNKIILSISLMLAGLAACSDDPESKVRGAAKQEIHETFLQGKVNGTFNGKAFTYDYSKSRDSKIRTAGNQTSLLISFGLYGVKTYSSLIIIRGYHGKGTYQDEMSLSPFLEMAKPRDKFKTLGKTINITEDSPNKLTGDFAFTVVSADNEKFIVDGSFDYKKIIIDINDEASLLNELKLNGSFMESLGDKRSDKDFIIKALEQGGGTAFNYADDKLRKDKTFILRALKEAPKGMVSLMMKVDKELLRDKGFALKMLAINPAVDYFLDKKLKKDKDIISATKNK